VPKKRAGRQGTLIGLSAFCSEDVLKSDGEAVVGFAAEVANILSTVAKQLPHTRHARIC
jgi:hypothetical protein